MCRQWRLTSTNRKALAQGKIKFTPVMVIESVSGEVEYFSAGEAFNGNDEAIEILKKYSI